MVWSLDVTTEVFRNYVLISFVIAWVLSILIKSYLKSTAQNKSFNIAEGIKTGGMPSSHSAVVASITTSLYLKTGFSDLFILSLVFSLIIISDAFGVRRNVGLQGDELNILIKRSKRKPIDIVYGHSLIQVIAGLLLGIFVSSFLYLIF